MKKGTIIIIATLIVYIVVGALIAQQYSGKPYELSQSSDWVYRARATNDLLDMSKYLNKSLGILENYSGNPAWIFPTPDTNLDYIKENIRECVGNCIDYSNLTDEMAYQQAVHNLQTTLSEIGEHLGYASDAALWQPIMFVYGIILGFGWLIIPVLLAVLLDFPLTKKK